MISNGHVKFFKCKSSSKIRRPLPLPKPRQGRRLGPPEAWNPHACFGPAARDDSTAFCHDLTALPWTRPWRSVQLWFSRLSILPFGRPETLPGSKCHGHWQRSSYSQNTKKNRLKKETNYFKRCLIFSDTGPPLSTRKEGRRHPGASPFYNAMQCNAMLCNAM